MVIQLLIHSRALLLQMVWDAGKVSFQREKDSLLEFVRGKGAQGVTNIEPWDWRYFAEKVSYFLRSPRSGLIGSLIGRYDRRNTL